MQILHGAISNNAMTILNLAQTVECTEAEGPGKRFAIWFQGCPMRCPSCCNPEMLSFDGGSPTRLEDLIQRIRSTQQTAAIEGVTLLGGEPFAHARGALQLAKQVQKLGLSVMIFSGFTLEELRSQNDTSVDELLGYTDILVDGRYEKELPETSRRWIGSRNQRIHFLSDRYDCDDIRWQSPNTLELRLEKGQLSVNGFPSQETKEFWKRPQRMQPISISPDKEIGDPIEEAIHGDTIKARRKALYNMEKACCSESTLVLFRNALLGSDIELRRRASETLGALLPFTSTDQVLPLLQLTLKDPSWTVREAWHGPLRNRSGSEVCISAETAVILASQVHADASELVRTGATYLLCNGTSSETKQVIAEKMIEELEKGPCRAQHSQRKLRSLAGLHNVLCSNPELQSQIQTSVSNATQNAHRKIRRTALEAIATLDPIRASSLSSVVVRCYDADASVQNAAVECLNKIMPKLDLNERWSHMRKVLTDLNKEDPKATLAELIQAMEPWHLQERLELFRRRIQWLRARNHNPNVRDPISNQPNSDTKVHSLEDYIEQCCMIGGKRLAFKEAVWLIGQILKSCWITRIDL